MLNFCLNDSPGCPTDRKWFPTEPRQWLPVYGFGAVRSLMKVRMILSGKNKGQNDDPGFLNDYNCK